MFSNKRLLNRKGDRNITILESGKFCTSKQPMPTMVLVSEFPIIWHAEVIWRALPELSAFNPEASPPLCSP